MFDLKILAQVLSLFFIIACTQEVKEPSVTFQEQLKFFTQSQDPIVAVNGISLNSTDEAQKKIEDLMANATQENPARITLSFKAQDGTLYTKEIIGFKP